MDSTDKLAEIFCKFPGIGPRQAKRFVFYLLKQDPARLSYFASLITDIKSEMQTCTACYRFYRKRQGDLCALCADQNRDDSKLMIVASDTDLESVEKSDSYAGRYFVLGGLIPILEKNPERLVRITELLTRIGVMSKSITTQCEIIFALSANTEGDYTIEQLMRLIRPLIESTSVTLSTLGRGLSTGSELEYADRDTIRNALKNRSR